MIRSRRDGAKDRTDWSRTMTSMMINSRKDWTKDIKRLRSVRGGVIDIGVVIIVGVSIVLERLATPSILWLAALTAEHMCVALSRSASAKHIVRMEETYTIAPSRATVATFLCLWITRQPLVVTSTTHATGCHESRCCITLDKLKLSAEGRCMLTKWDLGRGSSESDIGHCKSED